MGYTKFGEDTTLDDARSSCVYTVEALLAYPHAAIHELAQPLDALVEKADAVEVAVKRSKRAVVRASARVRTWDGVGDDRLREFVKDLLGEVRQNRESSLFKAFFPMTPTEMVALTLAPEVEEIERMDGVFDTKDVSGSLKTTWREALAEVATRGRAALAERKAANQAVAEASEEVTRWIEKADRLRRAIDGQLTTWAAEEGLAPDFNDRFFPETTRPRKKKDAAPETSPTPA